MLLPELFWCLCCMKVVCSLCGCGRSDDVTGLLVETIVGVSRGAVCSRFGQKIAVVVVGVGRNGGVGAVLILPLLRQTVVGIIGVVDLITLLAVVHIHGTAVLGGIIEVIYRFSCVIIPLTLQTAQTVIDIGDTFTCMIGLACLVADGVIGVRIGRQNRIIQPIIHPCDQGLMSQAGCLAWDIAAMCLYYSSTIAGG